MNRHPRQSVITSFSYLLVGFLSLIIAFPLFIFFHKQLPDYGWVYHTDRLVMFLFVVVFTLLLLRLFRPVIVIGFFLTIAWLGYGSMTGKYGFENLVSDYQAMMYAIKFEPGWDHTLHADEMNFPYRKSILKAADYRNPVVRNFAVEAATGMFRGQQRRYEYYRKLIQCFAVFKTINDQWQYVEDPEEGEYFAPAGESVKLMAGDCDDYAILMVASIKAIGGRSRFVRTRDHLYPEMQLKNKNELEMAITW